MVRKAQKQTQYPDKALIEGKEVNLKSFKENFIKKAQKEGIKEKQFVLDEGDEAKERTITYTKENGF